MRLGRLGSMHQSRLNFMRILTRRMAREQWEFSRPHFAIDGAGVGVATYVAQGPEHTYTLIAFAHDLPTGMRSDRVIATAWDATFTLFDGVPTPADIARLSEAVPKQEAGRVSARELTLSRANRSVRLWDQCVDALAAGRQPSFEALEEVGYLMRTTAVYGSGKFGAADYDANANRAELHAPFQAEMLTVWLIRTFVRDLVNHMARMRGGTQAVALEKTRAQALGIGNSTGLGLAPFIINHPILLNNWIMARETAIARVRAIRMAGAAEITLFRRLAGSATHTVNLWRSDHPVQQEKLRALVLDLGQIAAEATPERLAEARPWDSLVRWSEQALSLEGQELVASLILEPYGDLVDGLAAEMAASDTGRTRIDGAMPAAQVQTLIERHFRWALSIDWEDREACARAWYVSAEKLEPRLGERFREPIAAYEQPLAPARDAAAAWTALQDWIKAGDEAKDGAGDDTRADHPIAAFLLTHPEHRHSVRRAQITADAPYGEIRDNTIAAAMFPVDLLRAKLSFFGATRFDPRSDRWLRIAMFAGAPYPEDLAPENADYWVYPLAPQ